MRSLIQSVIVQNSPSKIFFSSPDVTSSSSGAMSKAILKICKLLYMRCQCQGRYINAVHFQFAFPPSIFQILRGQLRRECMLYAVLVTLDSAQKTYIWNINVECSMKKVLVWGADCLQIPQCMYTLKVLLLQNATDPPLGTTINFSLKPPLNNEFCPIYTPW